MKDIFITSTFRNEWNKSFNVKMGELLEAAGYTVFLPQRDSEQMGNRKETFLQDVAGVDSCKLIVAIGSKTQTANWGFEIGYAFKSGKPVIILTDREHPTELMPEGAATHVMNVDDLDDTSAYLDSLIAEIKRASSL
ncbi:MAG TPA: nucleoside 2-deoxyribosyltransferase [Candidatus Paceibacterota bacterium]|nr:nucleoside 2-deoxyribosyltransferase [Candidatus Paceibacterota bacterium]